MGFSTFFPSSLVVAADRQQHLLLTRNGLAGLFAFRSSSAGDAFFQRVHEVHNVLTAWSRFLTNRLSIPFGVDEFSQSFFVVVLELLGLEVSRLLADDVLRQVEHVLGNFHVLDVVKVFLLVPAFLGIAQ